MDQMSYIFWTGPTALPGTICLILFLRKQQKKGVTELKQIWQNGKMLRSDQFEWETQGVPFIFCKIFYILKIWQNHFFKERKLESI